MFLGAELSELHPISLNGMVRCVRLRHSEGVFEACLRDVQQMETSFVWMDVKSIKADKSLWRLMKPITDEFTKLSEGDCDKMISNILRYIEICSASYKRQRKDLLGPSVASN